MQASTHGTDLVGAVARAEDDARGRPARWRGGRAPRRDGQAAVGRGRDRGLVVALARARTAAGARSTSDRGAARQSSASASAALAGGQRPEAAVGGGAVAVHVAGAGLEHRRGQPGPARRRRRRAARRSRAAAGRCSRARCRPRPEAARAAPASAARRPTGRSLRWIGDVALEPREQRPRLGAGGVVDDDDLDVVGQVARDERLDLRPQRGRVVPGDDQDGGPHGRLMQPGLRCLGDGRGTTRRCAAGPRPDRAPAPSRGARAPWRPTGTGGRSRGRPRRGCRARGRAAARLEHAPASCRSAGELQLVRVVPGLADDPAARGRARPARCTPRPRPRRRGSRG